jgi:5-methylcytosine-specific restriction endonuclease McrA
VKSRDRYPQLKKDADGKRLCRGCGLPVPKGRQSWCSNLCFNTRCPQMVRRAVWERDKGICAICGVNVEAVRQKCSWRNIYQGKPPHQYDQRFRPNGINSPFDHARWERALATFNRHQIQWTKAAQKRLDKMFSLGWPRDNCRDWWEADHIIPHSEGGEYVLENMRTLCIPCHKARTKAWHKSRTR